MNYYLLLDHWAHLVRDFKDDEREHDRELYDSEQLARSILDYARFTRFRQYKLFTQKRGEEFERMLTKLETEGHPIEAVRRFLESEELWKTTLEFAEQ